jgi:hypothetical protein
MSTPPEHDRRAKRRGATRLAELVNRALDPLVARQGFGESTLLTQWETIVGARVSAISAPEKLIWPPRPKTRLPDAEIKPATLALRVEPGFGLDIQHMSGAIIERVNAHLGWRCVARLSLRQGALAPSAKPKREKVLPSDPAAKARAELATEGVAHDALRAALIALGERVLSERKAR